MEELTAPIAGDEFGTRKYRGPGMLRNFGEMLEITTLPVQHVPRVAGEPQERACFGDLTGQIRTDVCFGCWLGSPVSPVGVPGAQDVTGLTERIPGVTAEDFIGSLPAQTDFDRPGGELADARHREHRRADDR